MEESRLVLDKKEMKQLKRIQRKRMRDLRKKDIDFLHRLTNIYNDLKVCGLRVEAESSFNLEGRFTIMAHGHNDIYLGGLADRNKFLIQVEEKK